MTHNSYLVGLGAAVAAPLLAASLNQHMKSLATLHNAYIARGIFRPYGATKNPIDALGVLLSLKCAVEGKQIDPKSIEETRRYLNEPI